MSDNADVISLPQPQLTIGVWSPCLVPGPELGTLVLGCVTVAEMAIILL